MAVVVDARGFACPQPVIMTRGALRESDAVTTIVDNDTARHNVTRMAARSGYVVRAEPKADGIYLHIARGAVPSAEPGLRPAAAVPGGPVVLLVSGVGVGRGEAELGGILIRSFFHALGEVDPRPDTVIFINSGVQLVAESSPLLDDLRSLCSQGVEILACGTCLGYYGLTERVAVGEVSNMYTIAEAMLRAGKVVSL